MRRFRLVGFMRGFGSVLDLFPARDHCLGATQCRPEAAYDADMPCLPSIMSDEDAARSNWERVGEDMRRAINDNS